MTRTLRRIVAGALVAGAALTAPAAAGTDVHCHELRIANSYYRYCL